MAEDGAVKAAPLLSWACAPLEDVFVLVNLRYARSRDEMASGGQSVQMTMSPQQALELAEALRTRAETVLRRRSPERAN